MVRLAVDELIERLEITIEVLSTHTAVGGVDDLIEAVDLAKKILQHYVKPFTLQSLTKLSKALTDIDKP